MIRFIFIGDQINDEGKDFAFFNTIDDQFLSFDGDQVFSDVRDFATSAKDHPEFRRCLRLVPRELNPMHDLIEFAMHPRFMR